MYDNVNAPFPNMPYSPAVSPGYSAPVYGYGCPPHRGHGFAIIVVLFILLIIIGACAFCGFKD